MRGAEISVHELSIGYRKAGKAHLLLYKDIQFELKPGELTVLLGRNGRGKSTLLKTLLGIIPPLKGEVRYRGERFLQKTPASRAKLLSAVLAENPIMGNLKVKELVAIGRYSRTGWFGSLGEQDHNYIQKVMHWLKLEGLAERKLWEISDGERQKALIGRALAQDTPYIIMDEPMVHLDLPNSAELLSIIEGLATEGRSVLLSTHQIPLALKSAHQLIVLCGDGKAVVGKVQDPQIRELLDKEFLYVFNK